MPAIDLGALRFVFRGVYAPATKYTFNDVVNYNGDLYVYTAAYASTGVLPTNTTTWALMAPVAGAVNAALLAAAVLALGDPGLAERLEAWRAAQTASVAERPVTETHS